MEPLPPIPAGRPVVLVMVAGRPSLVTRVFDRCAAVIWAALPGFEGVTALAEVIAGAVNPRGRLPFAYPAAPSRILTYDHKPSEMAAQWVLPSRFTSTSPMRSGARKRSWFSSTPKSPSVPGSTTSSTAPEKTSRSGVTTVSSMGKRPS